jgi:hypothetical protein
MERPKASLADHDKIALRTFKDGEKRSTALSKSAKSS